MDTSNVESTAPAVIGVGAEPATPGRTSLPVWSFVMGLVSVLMAWTILPPVAAIILGALGLQRIAAGRGGSKWMAWTGLALGIVFTLSAPFQMGLVG